MNIMKLKQKYAGFALTDGTLADHYFLFFCHKFGDFSAAFRINNILVPLAEGTV